MPQYRGRMGLGGSYPLLKEPRRKGPIESGCSALTGAFDELKGYCSVVVRAGI